MKKKRNRNKYLIIIFIGIFLITSLYFFINDKDKIFDNLKKITASTINTDSNNHLSNELLEKEIDDLNKQISDLKEINNIDNLLTDKIVINASIIKRSPNYWYDYITINKGSKNGIKKGFGVISNNGLIGEVTIVNDNTSEVRLLCSKSNNYISAKFTYNDQEYFGIIKEYDLVKNELYLENVIGDLDNIKDIDVITSGLSSNIPSGILIGKIIDNKKDEFNLSNTITIRPTGDFNDINLVRVVGLVGVEWLLFQLY